MSKMIETYADRDIMRCMVTGDYADVNGVFADDEVKRLAAAYVFSGVKNLNKVSLPNLEYLTGQYAFYNYAGEIDISWGKLKEISGGNTFYNALKGDGELDLKFSSLTKFSSAECFYGCTDLRSVEFPELTSFEASRCFTGCTNLERIRAPKLERCSTMTSLHDSKVTVLNFPELMYYDGQAFQSIKNLQVLRIGGAVTSGQFASYGFGISQSNIPSLQTIIFDHLSDVPNMSETYFNLYIKQSLNNGADFFVPGDIADALKTMDRWSDYADQIHAIEDHPEVMPEE